MYNKTSIYNAFKGLVGWKEETNYPIARQTSGLLIVGRTYKILSYQTNDDFVNVGATQNVTNHIFVATGTTPTHWSHNSVLQDQTLLTSSSGLYFNDLSGINLENIQSSRPNDDLSTYLESIYNQTVVKLLDNFVSKSKIYLENKDLQKIKSVNNSIADGLITQTGSFIGYFINFSESYSLKLAIKNIALQVNKAQTIRVFLYNLNKMVAEKYIDLDCTNFDKTYTTLTDWILQYKTDTLSGNAYLIGYYEYQTAHPKTWQLDSDSQAYSNYSKQVSTNVCELIPVTIPSDYFNWNAITETFDLPNLTDIELSQITYNNMFFNYIIDVDYTNIIIDNVQRFAELLQYTMALKVVSDILGSNAFNQIQNSNLEKYTQLEKRLKVDINGFEVQSDNSIGYSNGLIQNLINEFENTDSVLFPIKRTIKF